MKPKLLIFEPDFSISEIIRFSMENDFQCIPVFDIESVLKIKDPCVFICDCDIYYNNRDIISKYLTSFDNKPGFILLSLFDRKRNNCDRDLVDYLMIKPFELDELILNIKELEFFNRKIHSKKNFSAYIPAKYSYISKIKNIILRTINDICKNEVDPANCRLIFEELAENTISHAYPDKFGYIEIILSFSLENNFSIEIRDTGNGFDMQDLNKSLEDYQKNIMRKRGRGLLLVKELSDDLIIESKPGKGTNIKAIISLSK